MMQPGTGRSKLPRPWNFHISCLDEHHVHVLVLRSAYSEAEVLDRFHLASKLLKAVLLNIANIAKSRRSFAAATMLPPPH